MTFTDADLCPTRTTRLYEDPLGARATQLIRDDEILVDTAAYGLDGQHWCRVVYVAPGEAAVYPYRARVPGRGTGQWAAREILAWRRSVEWHRVLNEAAAILAAME